MNSTGALVGALDRLEQFLRWVYPGVLFWVTLPLCFTVIAGNNGTANLANFYEGMPILGHIGIVIVAGFNIYFLERFVMHEFFLRKLAFRYLFRPFAIRIGEVCNFDENGTRSYEFGVSPLLWIRFGLRPRDDLVSGNDRFGERAENRFSHYLTNRMAWVHALGSTVIVGVLLILTARFVSKAPNVFDDWPKWGDPLYGALLAFLALIWAWQSWMVAGAEQEHYLDHTIR